MSCLLTPDAKLSWEQLCESFKARRVWCHLNVFWNQDSVQQLQHQHRSPKLNKLQGQLSSLSEQVLSTWIHRANSDPVTDWGGKNCFSDWRRHEGWTETVAAQVSACGWLTQTRAEQLKQANDEQRSFLEQTQAKVSAVIVLLPVAPHLWLQLFTKQEESLLSKLPLLKQQLNDVVG